MNSRLSAPAPSFYFRLAAARTFRAFLYQLAIGWNGQPPNATACIFWLKNRRKDRWRDVQNLEADVGHYILSDRPMSEEQWIAERTTLEAKRLPDATEPQHSQDTSDSSDT